MANNLPGFTFGTGASSYNPGVQGAPYRIHSTPRPSQPPSDDDDDCRNVDNSPFGADPGPLDNTWWHQALLYNRTMGPTDGNTVLHRLCSSIRTVATPIT